MVNWTEEEYNRVSEAIRTALHEQEYLYHGIPQTHIPTVKNIKDAVRLTAKEKGANDEN